MAETEVEESMKITSCIRCFAPILAILLTSLCCRVYAAEAQPPTLLGGTILRGPDGGLAVVVRSSEPLDSARVRLFFDTDSTSGDLVQSADWMIEGPTLYKRIPGDSEWAWEPLGPVFYVKDDGQWVCLFDEPALQGEIGCRIEITAEDWSVVDALDLDPVSTESLVEYVGKTGPEPPDLSALLAFRPSSLSIQWNGGPLNASWQEVPLDQSPMTTSLRGREHTFGVTLQDASSGDEAALKPEKAWRQGDQSAWSGETMGISWVLVSEVAGDSIALRGWLKSGTDRFLSVKVGVSADFDEATWHDDMQSEKSLDGATTASGFFGGSRYGKAGRQSFYPFGVIQTPRGIEMLETDLNEPRVYHILANPAAEQMVLVYDMALSQDTVKFPGQATFSARFASLPPSPSNGFRVALADFFKRYPDFEKRRVPSSGQWMPFFDISKIPNSEDFGFSFFEKGGVIGEDVDFAKANDILTLMYTEPWLYWHPMTNDVKRTPEVVKKRMNQFAMAGTDWSSQLAASSISAAALDSTGNIPMRFMDVPWNSGARIEINTDPDIKAQSPSRINRAMAEWQQIADWMKDERVDGVYLDSMDTLSAPDFRKEALEATDYPATFTLAGMRPVIADRIGQYEFTAMLGGYLRANNKYLMGNFPVVDMPFLNRWIDIPGEETSWFAGGQYHPPSDAKLRYRRAMSGQKPFGFLQATDFDKFQGEPLIRYFQTCMFFGFQPGFFSADGANDPYWLNQKWYERDRPIFRTFMPLIRRLADAGWQVLPEVGFETPHESLTLEQFGRSGDGIWHVTIRNTSPKAKSYALTQNDSVEGSFTVLNPLTGETGRLSQRDTYEARIPGNSVQTLDVMAPEFMEKNLAFLKDWQSAESIVSTVSLESMIAESNAGIVASVENHGGALVEGEASEWSIRLENQGTDDLQAGLSDASMSALPAGGSITLKTSVPARDPMSQSPVSLAWTIKKGATATTFQRSILAPQQPRILVTGPGKRIVVPQGTAAKIPISISNHSANQAEFRVEWSGDLGQGSQALNVPARDTQSLALEIPSLGASAGEVLVQVLEGDHAWYSSPTYIVFSDGSSSLAAQSQVGITVDSTFSGYSTGPLNDGVTDTTGLAWNEGAWASDDSTTEHWVQMDFPEPQNVSRVVIDWNVEGGTTYSARSGRVVGVLADGSQVTLAKIENASPTPRNTLHFQSVELKSLRIIQSAGGGAPERPGIFWLREIGVF